MRDQAFTVFVEELRHASSKQIDETVPADFLDVKEKDLAFKDPVTMQGEAYIAGDMLVLHLVIVAYGILPCTICNSPVKVEIKLDNLYHAEPLEQVKSGIFDFRNVVREAILLEAPPFAECDGKCSQRKEIKKYLAKEGKKKSKDDGYHPFADL